MRKLRLIKSIGNKFKFFTAKIRNRSVKTKLFISNLLLINSVILIFWIFGYNWVSYSERAGIIDQRHEELDSIIQNVDNEFISLSEFSIKLSETRWVKKLMMRHYDPEGEDLLALIDYKDELSLYSTLNSFVNTQSIYFNSTNRLMTTSGFTNTNIFFRYSFNMESFTVDDWERLLSVNNSQALMPSKVRIYGRELDGLVYLNTIPAYSEYDVRATLITFIENKNIEEVFDSITSKNPVTSYILDDAGRIIYSKNPSTNVINLIENEQIKGTQDNITEKDEIVFTNYSAKTGFTYIIGMPEDMAMKELHKVELLVTVIFVILMILGIAMAYILALKNFRPVQELISLLKNSTFGHETEQSFNEYQWLQSSIKNMLIEENALHGRLENQKPILKKYYLSRLVNEEKNIGDELIKTLDVLGISFPYKMFCCFVISFGKNKDRINADDFIYKTIDNKGIEYERVSKNDHEIVICNFYNQSQLSESIINIKNVIDKYNVILSIGNTYDSIRSVPASYMEALESTNYRTLKELERVVQYSDIDSNVSSYYYPLKKENAIIVHLTSGSSEKAYEVVDELIDFNIENRKVTINAIKQLFFDIDRTVLRVVEDMDIDNKPSLEISEEFNLSDIDEMKQRLKKKFDILSNLVAEKKEKSSDEFDRSILDYIDQSFRDSSLSLGTLSEMFNLSESHLSRTFKQKFGVNYLDYVNKKRVEYALSLLKNSDSDINEIAQRAGFNNDVTFRRLFKKYYGTSPLKYKEAFLRGDDA